MSITKLNPFIKFLLKTSQKQTILASLERLRIVKALYLLFPFFIFCTSETQNKSITEFVETPQIALNKSVINRYAWKPNYTIENKLINRIAIPRGYSREPLLLNSFGDWLRNLPLKAGNPKVLLYNGSLKGNQTAQYAVLDIDVGKKDLQQCADAVMRIRAEYLFSTQLYSKISFNFTSGDVCKYSEWRKGIRPKISGNKVSFHKTKSEDASYGNFKKYMEMIFMYCGTHSLEKELKEASLKDIKAGDIFIMGGFPGHAVMVVDVAINKDSNDKIFLLAQSYMPAQDIHILKNPSDDSLSPWFSISFGETLQTPEWNFNKSALKSFY